MSAKVVWRNDPSVLKMFLQSKVQDRALKLSRKIFDGVVSRSPVYTGSLRASWNAAIGAPDLSRVEHKDSGSPLPAPSFPLQHVPMGARVYITNSTPYIMRVEYEGWSQQAPNGMVRITLASLGIGRSVRR